MSIGKVTVLALLAAGLGVFQYQRDIQAARGAHSAAQSALTEAREVLQSRNARIAEISKAMADESAKLKEAKDSLQLEVAALQKDKAALLQEFTLAVQEVRSATVGMRWPSMNLADGRMLQQAVIRRVGDSAVEISHISGVEQLSAGKLPPELQDRLHYTPAPSEMAVAGQPQTGAQAQAGTQGAAPSSANVAGIESSIRQLEQTRAKLSHTRSSYLSQANDYRNKDAMAMLAGKRPLYSQIIPKVEASVLDLARKISEVNIQISNLEIELATIRSGTVGKS